MGIAPQDFANRLRALVGLQGTPVTEEELLHVTESYAQCPGSGLWEVREYARYTGRGAREYRVVRGTSVQDVYRSFERARATAVGAALNELELQK